MHKSRNLSCVCTTRVLHMFTKPDLLIDMALSNFALVILGHITPASSCYDRKCVDFTARYGLINNDCQTSILKIKHHDYTHAVMSAYMVALKTRFGNVETRCICTEFISKTRYQNVFCYNRQSEFRSVKAAISYVS